MADTKISDLTAATSLADTDLFVIAQEDTANKKVTWETVREETETSSPVMMLATVGYTVVQGTWVRSVDNGQSLGLYLNSTSDAQNDELTYKVFLGTGTYTIELLHVKAPAVGIYTISVDGVSAGTIDGYNGIVAYNNYDTLTGISVSVSGLKTISVKMATKNASSSAYRGIFSALVFHRTA